MSRFVDMDYDEVLSISQQLLNKKNELETVVNKMSQALMELVTEWRGDASDAMEARYQSFVQPTFDTLCQLIEDRITTLQKVAKSIKAIDEFLARTFPE